MPRTSIAQKARVRDLVKLFAGEHTSPRRD